MGYDIHLIRFVHGEPQARPAGRVHGLLNEAARSERDRFGCARVARGGGDAEVYGMTASPEDPVSSLMFSRPAGSHGIFDLIFEVAAAGDMAILLPEGEVCLTEPAQAEHLPGDMQGWPRRVVDSGESLAAAVTGE